MRRIETVIAALLIVALSLSPAQAKPSQPAQGEIGVLREEVENYKKDISAINLINALNLSREQEKTILELARQAARARADVLESVQAREALAQARTAFAELRAEIQKGQPGRGEIPARAQAAEARLRDLRDTSLRQLAERYKAIEDTLGATLSAEQRAVVARFNPCLIPPADLRDPVRAGQAASDEGAVKLMRRVRQMPEAVWKDRKAEIVDRAVENYSHKHFRLTEPEKKAEEKRVLAVLDQARAMDDLRFETDKDMLAEKLRPGDRMGKLRAELAARNPHENPAKMDKAGNILLDERVIPIFEERLSGKALAKP